MKQVKGYLTKDGTFYERETLAMLHDAHEVLAEVAGEDFIATCDSHLMIVKEYVDVKIACAHEEQQVEWSKNASDVIIDGDTAIYEGTESNDEAIHPLTAYGRSDVSDMGSGTQPEEIQDRSKKHGTRSRKGNA